MTAVRLACAPVVGACDATRRDRIRGSWSNLPLPRPATAIVERVPLRPLHKQDCRGCGATFRTHTRTRVYCQDGCKLLLQHVKHFRHCLGCGAKDESRPLIVWARTPEYERQKQLGVEFATAHMDCRAEMLEPRGRGLECQCRSC